jgi:hypothetical protein
MSRSKNHNSILFLTTLGVYLGLVLAGGVSPALAHAAMTRNFELKDEIEVKDDLDNKPDDERSTLSDSIKTYLQDVEYFLSDLRNLGQANKFNLERDAFEVAQTTQLPCIAENKIGSYTANSFVNENPALRPWLERFSKRLTDGYSLGDCLPSERFGGNDATDSHFTFKLDKAEFVVEVAVKKRTGDSAHALLGELQRTLDLFKPNDKEIVRQHIYENTSFASKNDQVFVITRLPRAGLDSLLAKDAK